MSAPHSVSSSNTGDTRAYEPSMEEILASIRRIIADDQSMPRSGQPELGPPPAPHPDGRTASTASLAIGTDPKDEATRSAAPEASSSPFEMPHEPMAAAQGTIAAPQYPMPDVAQAVPASPPEGSAASAHVEPTHVEPTRVEPTRVDPPLVAPLPAERPGASDDEMPRAAVPASREPTPLFSSATNQSVTSAFNALAVSRLADKSDELMGIAREMIRPLLQRWLDDNLPNMVERMVREEIERVARGGP